MAIRMRAVIVRQLPEILNAKQGRAFFRELQSYINVDRPLVVIDCSNVSRVDRHVIHLLLCCLEEAMKRKGDIKLAALPPGAEAILELTKVDRLFDIYATTEDAVNSFHLFPADWISQLPMSMPSRNEPESAA